MATPGGSGGTPSTSAQGNKQDNNDPDEPHAFFYRALSTLPNSQLKHNMTTFFKNNPEAVMNLIAAAEREARAGDKSETATTSKASTSQSQQQRVIQPVIPIKAFQDKISLHSTQIPVRTERFYSPPVSFIPVDAFQKPVECTFYGFDVYGHAYIRFHDYMADMENTEMLRNMAMIYSNSNPNKIKVDVADVLEEGEFLVAKILEKVGYENVEKYIRVQLLEMKNKTDAVVVNIDDQTTHPVKKFNLFWLTKYFHKSPMLTLKCPFKYLEKFLGTTVPYETSLAYVFDMNFLTLTAQVIELDTKVDMVADVICYTTTDEATYQTGSFNQDILNLIPYWNKGPLEFEPGMVLTNVKLTHALPNGQIWIQLGSGLMDFIHKKLIPTIDLKSIPMISIVKKVKKLLARGQTHFLSKYSNQTYYRTQLLGKVLDNEVGEVSQWIVKYVDYGTVNVLHEYELLPYEYFDEFFEPIPPQAFQATLRANDRSGFFLNSEDIRELTSPSSKIKVEIVDVKRGPNDEKNPVVNVYFLPDPHMPRFMGIGVPVEEDSEPTISDRIPHVKVRFPLKPEVQRHCGKMFEFQTKISWVKQTTESHILRIRQEHPYKDCC